MIKNKTLEQHRFYVVFQYNAVLYCTVQNFEGYTIILQSIFVSALAYAEVRIKVYSVFIFKKLSLIL
jgi:hypothetical protein